MPLDNQFIKKNYYVTLIENNKTAAPVEILGEMLLEEQNSGGDDFSSIRFAQGELYFHFKDFETAIFKWEKVKNELKPWAKKNIADAYFELHFLSKAEEIYTSISSENPSLNTETALQLFTLYIEQNKIDMAARVIKNTVAENPDYPNVTDLARAFFEEHRDWNSAVELAVSETTRTESMKWFDVLRAYVEKSVTKNIEPDYFSNVLITLYRNDKNRFEELTAAFWDSYKNEEMFLLWIDTINNLFKEVGINESDSWRKISALYQETYLYLINGKYFVKEIAHLVPSLLTNWVKLTDSSHALFASAALLAWNQIFPSTISEEAAAAAEKKIGQSSSKYNWLDDILALFDTIENWAKQHGIEVGHRFQWIVGEMIDLENHHLLVAGSAGSGKSSFINSMLGENISSSPTSALMMFKNHEEVEINEITDTEITSIEDVTEFHERTSKRRQKNDSEICIDFRLPNQILQKNRLSFIDSPALNRSVNKHELFTYLHLADSLLFVLNASDPLTDEELQILLKIKKQAPHLPVHFLLNKVDTVYNEQEALRILDETEAKVNTYFPNAQVFAYSSHYKNQQQTSDFEAFLSSKLNNLHLKKHRTEKLLSFTEETITYLLEKRIEMENSLTESIHWNEDMVLKLTAALHQLNDLQTEKAENIQHSYHVIMKEIQEEITKAIPALIRSCSDMIKEDSDFRKIHFQLNEEINKRIQDYLQNTILPKLYSSIQDWISDAQEELVQSKIYLDEMSEGFNALYGEERIQLECDFRILDDWLRDAGRMTSGIRMETVNVFLRSTPSQLVLKSVGKLFGSIPQNKTMLYNKYKQFIENGEYDELTESIANKFFMQFELFETSLERDIHMFFKNSFTVLTNTVEETEIEIQEKETTLTNMKTKPEHYHDPLTLFKLKLRQYEWMTLVGGNSFQLQ
ncbi:dynamin family protein [Bacillus taeanensis]|uniref:GTP-binding protein n=1 Tax=Bacillus taeanensis TaxID=273032 RepID=A0A366XX64_9BACI|nr:dynamin family protein [Bacillus taeanensis]RBW70158.1 GTP-binding protein [Bacillus taeanensis]